MGDDVMDGQRMARHALWLGIGALLAWPVSYADLLSPDRPRLILFAIVPLAEIAALVLGYLAVESGLKARRAGATGSGAVAGMALGAVVVALIVAGTVLNFLAAI